MSRAAAPAVAHLPLTLPKLPQTAPYLTGRPEAQQHHVCRRGQPGAQGPGPGTGAPHAQPHQLPGERGSGAAPPRPPTACGRWGGTSVTACPGPRRPSQRSKPAGRHPHVRRARGVQPRAHGLPQRHVGNGLHPARAVRAGDGVRRAHHPPAAPAGAQGGAGRASLSAASICRGGTLRNKLQLLSMLAAVLVRFTELLPPRLPASSPPAGAARRGGPHPPGLQHGPARRHRRPAAHRPRAPPHH